MKTICPYCGQEYPETPDEPKEDSIDHIAVPASVEVLLQHAVIDREALDASDHSPVYADVEFGSRENMRDPR